MKHRRHDVGPRAVSDRMNRRDHKSLRLWFFVIGILAACLFSNLFPNLTPGAIAQEQVTSESPRTLILADVQVQGAMRTNLPTVYRHLGLLPGQVITQNSLITGVENLRQSSLFKSVSFFTRRGAERGQLILVLEVEEHGFDFRWAAGNTNLDGWYLVPAMVAYDNPLGRGGLLDLSLRWGFRHTGTFLRYARPSVADGRSYWGATLFHSQTDRPYFSEGVEYRHLINTGGLATVFGRRLNTNQLAEFGLDIEGLDATDESTAYITSPDGAIVTGQKIPPSEMPPDIQGALGYDTRATVHLDFQHDTRSQALRAGTPVDGFWGRVKASYVFQNQRSHPTLQADLRFFREVPGGVLAARARGAWVGKKAAFYDRLYLGGLYTVRGFPTHSLSAPGGDTWLASGSLEYRSRILGQGEDTRLAGIFFLDAGASGSGSDLDPSSGIAVGAGYGIRWKVWWLDWVGVDVGFPLTERPVDMGFQATASIGWAF